MRRPEIHLEEVNIYMKESTKQTKNPSNELKMKMKNPLNELKMQMKNPSNELKMQEKDEFGIVGANLVRIWQ